MCSDIHVALVVLKGTLNFTQSNHMSCAINTAMLVGQHKGLLSHYNQCGTAIDVRLNPFNQSNLLELCVEAFATHFNPFFRFTEKRYSDLIFAENLSFILADTFICRNFKYGIFLKVLSFKDNENSCFINIRSTTSKIKSLMISHPWNVFQSIYRSIKGAVSWLKYFGDDLVKVSKSQ